MQCKRCGHDTNHETGICAACNIDNKFKVGGATLKGSAHLNPASRRIVAKKQNQGSKVKMHTGSASSQNPYLLDDLQLLILAQLDFAFQLAREGDIKQAIKRIRLTNEALRNAKPKKHI